MFESVGTLRKNFAAGSIFILVFIAGCGDVSTGNVAPTANDQSVDIPENTATAVTLTAFDPEGDALVWVLDTAPVHGTLSGTAPDLIYTPNAGWTSTDIFTFFVSDVRNDSNTATVSITVIPPSAPPVVDAGIDASGDEGDEIVFSGTFNDPDLGETHTFEWDFGDGTTETGTLSSNHEYADDGTYTVTLTVTDQTTASGSDTMITTIDNVPPEIDAGTDQAVAEGDTVRFTGDYSDAGSADTHEMTWDFGDGTTETGTLIPNHVYMDDGTYSITLTVTDDDGGASSDTITITVINSDPVVYAGSDQTVNVGETVYFTGSFTDAGSEDTHTFEWRFGDGSPSVSDSLTPIHIFTSSGVYTITLTVSDDDGGASTDSSAITVN